MTTYDVIIIGAGPAGLNAALVLGRCGRRTLVLDSGKPRNAASRALHGFLTRDGTSPHDLRRLGRQELAAYPSVEIRDTAVTDAEKLEPGFRVTIADQSTVHSHTLLLATGRVDRVPAIPGFKELMGRGVYHCPYCDAWEHRGEKIAVFGDEESARSLAETLSCWTEEILVCVDGKSAESSAGHKFREAAEPIARLEAGRDGLLQAIRFESGAIEECRAMFFCGECDQRSSLPERLGCAFDQAGSVACTEFAATNVPGLFVAGNVRGGIHLAIMAAAEGAEAAIGINNYLLDNFPC